jgi:hypothetical protein
MSDVALADPPLVEAAASPEEATSERLARLFGPVVIAMCAGLAYANSFRVPFVFDSDNYLLNGEKIRHLWPLGPLFEHSQTRPVGYLSFALNYAAAGYSLPSWHATNLAIHIIAACALFGIARRTLLRPRFAERFGRHAARVALAIAVVWVVHPLNTQSVTYLYQRLESLMGMFYLLTLYAFVRYCGSANIGWTVASVVCFLLSATTKEVAVTAPLMVLWYDRAFWSPSWYGLVQRRGIYHVVLWAALVVPAMLIYDTRNEYPNAGILDYGRVTSTQYAITQTEVVTHYLRLSVVPWPLNIDYAWPIQKDWRVAIAPGLFLATLLALTAFSIRQWPTVGFLGGWWFVILAPTSSIAPIIDLAFEHRTYLSLIAPVSLVIGLGYLGIRKLVDVCGGEPETASVSRAALLMLFVAALTMLTLRRNHDYRSSTALWGDVAQKSPHNPRAHYNHGVYLQTEGTPESIAAAIEEYHETLRLDPNYVDAYLNLGNLAAWKNQLPQAIDYFQKALAINGNHVPSLYGLADTLERNGDTAAARSRVDQLLQLDPNHADGQALLARLSAMPATFGPHATPHATAMP